MKLISLTSKGCSVHKKQPFRVLPQSVSVLLKLRSEQNRKIGFFMHSLYLKYSLILPDITPAFSWNLATLFLFLESFPC